MGSRDVMKEESKASFILQKTHLLLRSSQDCHQHLTEWTSQESTECSDHTPPVCGCLSNRVDRLSTQADFLFIASHTLGIRDVVGFAFRKYFPLQLSSNLALLSCCWCSPKMRKWPSFFVFLLSLSSDEQLQLGISSVVSLVAANLHG